jgi:hypothetical protein
MKNKLAQLYVFVNKMDQRYVQFAYFAFMLTMYFLSPSDGGGTGR